MKSWALRAKSALGPFVEHPWFKGFKNLNFEKNIFRNILLFSTHFDEDLWKFLFCSHFLFENFYWNKHGLKIFHTSNVLQKSRYNVLTHFFLSTTYLKREHALILHTSLSEKIPHSLISSYALFSLHEKFNVRLIRIYCVFVQRFSVHWQNKNFSIHRAENSQSHGGCVRVNMRNWQLYAVS